VDEAWTVDLVDLGSGEWTIDISFEIKNGQGETIYSSGKFEQYYSIYSRLAHTVYKLITLDPFPKKFRFTRKLKDWIEEQVDKKDSLRIMHLETTGLIKREPDNEDFIVPLLVRRDDVVSNYNVSHYFDTYLEKKLNKTGVFTLPEDRPRNQHIVDSQGAVARSLGDLTDKEIQELADLVDKPSRSRIRDLSEQVSRERTPFDGTSHTGYNI